MEARGVVGERAGASSVFALDPRLDACPHPVVVSDRAGTLVGLNRTAQALFPAARPGSRVDSTVGWLADAHHLLVEHPGEGDVGTTGVVHGRWDDRSFEARPTRHDDATVTWWLVENTEMHLARDAVRSEQARTAFLSEVSQALLGSLNLTRCMAAAAELATTYLCDAAWLLAPGRGGRLPAVFCARGGEVVETVLEVDTDEVAGLSEALQGFPPVPSRWLDAESVPGWVSPDGFGPVRSVVVTPLPGHGVSAGAMILLRSASAPQFSEGEEVVARLFAARVGVAMSAARVYAQQASITETLMRDLLPPVLQQVAGVEFAGRYRAASDGERVGGDFYDVHHADDAESLVVLGDVCGKGLDAAVFAGKIRSIVHALLPMADDHLQMLRLLNGSLLGVDDTRFATVVLASVARRGAEVRLRLTSGGHLPPLIVRADGRVEEAPTRGLLIGALPEITATTAEAVLGPGETCLLYSDGITEARGGPFGDELFDDGRLHRALTECAGMPAEAVVERIAMLVAQWIGDAPHDDMALVAITAPRGQHLTAVGGHGRGRYTA